MERILVETKVLHSWEFKDYHAYNKDISYWLKKGWENLIRVRSTKEGFDYCILCKQTIKEVD